MSDQMTLLGGITPKNVIHKIESHKLMNAFPVATGKVIVESQQVVILADGTIRAFEAGDNINHIIGTAITGSAHPAYTASLQRGPIEVTVAMRGFAIVYGIASEEIDAGPIVPTGALDATNRYVAYKQAAIVTSAAGNVTSVGDPVLAIALNPADASELIQLLIL